MKQFSTKEHRDRLFKKSRPLVRAFDPIDDMWVLWAAYDLKSFPRMKDGMNKDEFAELVMGLCATRSSCLVIEDDCRYFKSGRGPVAFVIVDNYGWRIEPIVDFFMWATPRMILRCNVAFFQMARYSKNIGVCLVRSPVKTANLFRAVKRYGLLFEVGRIPNGRPGEDEYIFSVNGLKKA